jgi:phosphatidylserine/phosphatidylglycerophosphate/cardiolipin synthase-like enzyme
MAITKEYEPVVRSKKDPFWGAALVGTHSVIIGWDVKKEDLPKQLMGFAVRRMDFDPETDEILRLDWLNGQKRFKGTGGDFGDEIRSDQAPFQRFRWNDYTVTADRSYRYEVFPMFGKPGSLKRGEALTFDLRPSKPVDEGVGVYANRGVTAAMAYLNRFKNKHPAEVEDGRAYRWLERGMRHSLFEFIEAARPGEHLHVCIYEFFDEEVAQALKAANGRGVKVGIVYHAKPNDKATKENEQVIAHVKIKPITTQRTNTGNISHNKFVVHLDKSGRPKRLWTASANFSTNAFYFQTNVALTFDKPELAACYENYFQILKKNPVRGRKKKGHVFAQDEVEMLNRQTNEEPPSPVNRVLFSPVRSLHVVKEAIGLIEESESAIFFSAPFGVGKEVIAAIGANDTGILEYGLANSTAKKKILALNRMNTRFFTPSRMKTYMGRRWDAKAFGAHKIHAKTLVIDPWGDNPSVLIGSANFSEGSCRENDENTMLIKGDKRFAAIIATEFLRMYDHYKIRYWVNKLENKDETATIYLDDSPDWTRIYFRQTHRSRKFRDRQVFAGGI